MAGKKSPQLLKSKVVGGRFTPHEIAALTILANGQALGTYVREIVMDEVNQARREGRLDPR